MNEKNKRLLEKKRKEKDDFRGAVARYRKKRKIEFVIILSLISLVVAIIYFFNSNYVKLKNINVTGIEQITKDEILSVTELNNEVKYFNADLENIKNRIINSSNIIENVEVSKKMFQTITITVKERKLLALEKNDDNHYIPVLDNGDLYKKELKKGMILPIIEEFKEDIKKRNDLLKNLNELHREVLTNISEITNVTDSEEALIYMRDGQKVKVNAHNFSGKLNYYFEIEKYISDKYETTLNLVNGSYLETKKTLSTKENKIKNILLRDTQSEKEVEKKENTQKENIQITTTVENIETSTNNQAVSGTGTVKDTNRR